MNKELEKYVNVVEFLGHSLGRDTEIVLHDASNLESSVVAIANGHISGRKVGAPATNLVLSTLQNKKKDQDYVCNYKGISNSGLDIKSATYFIKNDDAQIIGMLCINRNISKLTKLRDNIESVLEYEIGNIDPKVTAEKFSKSSDELKINGIDDIINSFNVSPSRMSLDEKLEVVKKLNDTGIFLIKGSVSDVAKKLCVSEPTVYRYLHIIKNN